MIFLSELQRRKVVDRDGQPLGRIADLVVNSSEAFPSVRALTVQGTGHSSTNVPWHDVADFESSPIRLNVIGSDISAGGAADDDIRLAHDVLDHQILDTKGRRVVKVNDLKLTEIRGQARLVGADVSFRGYLRRLGLDGLVNSLRLPLGERLITWNYVEGLNAEDPDLRLTATGRGVFDLHPADIAELIDHMSTDEGAALLDRLDNPLAAEALTELDPDVQEDLLERMGTERAADLLEIMPADDAADILGELSEEQAEEYLVEMQPADAAEVRDLLRYDDESAGGIMSPEVLAIRQDLTVEDAINRLRQLPATADVAYSLFVVDANDHLAGIVSLRDLVTAAPATHLETIMQRQVIKVPVNTDQEEAARIISKYDLMALPVVEESGKLIGVITVDDIIDVIQEEADEDLSAIAGTSTSDVEGVSGALESALNRLRLLVVGIAGGLVAAALLRSFAGSTDLSATVVAFVPLLVVLAGQAVGQSLAVVGRGLGLGEEGELAGRESRIGALLAAAAGLLAGAGAMLLSGDPRVGLVVGLSASLTTVLAVAVGTLMPIVANRVAARAHPRGQPLIAPFVGLLSILLYLGLATAFLNR